MEKRFYELNRLDELEKEFKTLPVDGEGRVQPVEYDEHYVRSVVLKLIADNRRLDRHLHGVLGICEGLEDDPTRAIERIKKRTWKALGEDER